MTGKGLSQYALLYRMRKDQFSTGMQSPVLLWELPPSAPEADDQLLGTAAHRSADRPTSSDPLVFEVRKANNNGNAFSMGITIGRTDNNDIVIEDNSVSRFHAYLLKDERHGGWKLVDADSSNGTWLSDHRLGPGEQRQLPDGSTIKLGEVVLKFYSPMKFLEKLKELSGG